MGDAAEAPQHDERTEVQVECEHCGHAFTLKRPTHRKEECPECGMRTLIPFQRAPIWWIAVFGAALLAVAIPGLTYRWLGPSVAAPVAFLALGSLWLLGRRL